MEIGNPIKLLIDGMTGQLHNKEDREQVEDIGKTMTAAGVMLIAADLTASALGELSPTPTPGMDVDRGTGIGV